MRDEFQSPKIDIMEVKTPPSISDVVADDQDYGEERLDNARGDIAEELPNDSLAHDTGAMRLRIVNIQERRSSHKRTICRF